MSITLNEDFRKKVDSLLENVAIGIGVKSVLRDLVYVIDNYNPNIEQALSRGGQPLVDAPDNVERVVE